MITKVVEPLIWHFVLQTFQSVPQAAVMNQKPPLDAAEELPEPPGDDGSFDNELAESEFLQSETDDPSIDDLDEEEFSLERLSQAYARVLKGTENDVDKDAAVKTSDADNAEIASRSKFQKNVTEDSQSDVAEVDDDAACPISPESIVEAILFVGVPSGVKLTTRKIAAVLRDVSPKEVSKIIKQLNQRYVAENSAYRIIEADGELKFSLDESLDHFQQDFFGRNKSVKLSQTAIDVLAVVAYNQPLTREEVEKLRGKSSGSVLKQLVKRGLLAMLERESKNDGNRYVTTDKFLNFFRLAEIEDLPQSHEVSDFDELAD